MAKRRNKRSVILVSKCSSLFLRKQLLIYARKLRKQPVMMMMMMKVRIHLLTLVPNKWIHPNLHSANKKLISQTDLSKRTCLKSSNLCWLKKVLTKKENWRWLAKKTSKRLLRSSRESKTLDSRTSE
jgi:hypothetical protein